MHYAFGSKEQDHERLFGDTQCYKASEVTEVPVDNVGFFNRVDWIVENKDAQNIVFVSHLGDIVDNPAVTNQWLFASQQMKRLEVAGIPYGIAPGNHDMSWGDVSVFSEYFPASRYASYGDSYESFGLCASRLARLAQGCFALHSGVWWR